MTRWLNGYTLIPLLIITVVLMNTVEKVLLNGGTVSWVLGILLFVVCIWFIIVNIVKILMKLLMELENM